MRIVLIVEVLFIPLLRWNYICKDLPTVRSIKLGVTIKDFLNLTKGYNTQIESRYLARKFDSPPSELFNGVESIEINEYQGKTYWYSVEYKKDIAWNNAKEFAQNLSQNLNLPYDS